MSEIKDKLKMPAEIQIACINNNFELSPDRIKTTTFAQRLKLVIDHSAMSMTTFAQRCKLSESAIRKYICGHSEPTLHNLVTLSQVGNVPLSWLATGQISQFPSPTHQITSYLSAASNDHFLMINEVNFYSLTEEKLEIIPNSQWSLSKKWLERESLQDAYLAFTTLNCDSIGNIAKYGDLSLINIKQKGWMDAIEGVFIISLHNRLLIRRIQFDPIKNGYILCSDNNHYRDQFIRLNGDLNFKIIAKIEHILMSAL